MSGIPKTIRAISLHQPYASLIAIGAKRIETRHWALKTNDRSGDFIDEPFVIHAAKTRTSLSVIETNDRIAKVLYSEGLINFDFDRKKLISHSLPMGSIVAVANQVRCYPQEKLDPKVLNPLELACGYYAAGRFGWVLDDVFSLVTPIPYLGRQGLFSVESYHFRQRRGYKIVECLNDYVGGQLPGGRRILCHNVDDILECLYPAITGGGHIFSKREAHIPPKPITKPRQVIVSTQIPLPFEGVH